MFVADLGDQAPKRCTERELVDLAEVVLARTAFVVQHQVLTCHSGSGNGRSAMVFDMDAPCMGGSTR